MKNYRELLVWQEAMNLVEYIYKFTSNFPAVEKFGLANQMQRAAVSVPANIAEGYGRNSRKEYLYHLSIAKGSLAELETHLIIADRLNYIEKITFNECWEIAQKTGKLLTGLQKSLKI